MRHGLEGRTPFVDRMMSVYGFRLPHAAKIGPGGGKHLVKSWLESRLPASRPFARKRGFTVPVGEWISEEAQGLAPLVADQPGIAAVMKPQDARAIITDAGGRGGLLAWRVLFYALWHQVHVCRVDPYQPLADILATRG